MGLGTISILDTLKWSEYSGSQVAVEVRTGIIAVFFSSATNTAKCATFSYTSAGVLTKLDEQTITGITSCAIVFSAIKIADGIAAFTYINTPAPFNGFVSTVAIAADGTITTAALDTLEFDDNTYESTIIHATGDFWVIAFTEEGGDTPYIVTVDIDNIGAIEAAITASQQLNASGSCGSQTAIKLADGKIAIFYDSRSGGDILSYVETRTISAAGAISAVIDGPDTWGGISGAQNMCAFNVSGTIYACSYKEGASLDGWVNTFNISVAGVITSVDIDSFEFDVAGVDTYPKGKAGGGIGIFFYEESSTFNGLAKTVVIDSVGAIGASVLDIETVDAVVAVGTDIIKISDTLYIVVWLDTNSDGQAASLSVSLSPGEGGGIIAIVESRLHYVDAYGTERYIEGTIVT